MFAAIQKIKNLRLFQRNRNLETARQIISWWELRRIPYNLIVGATGILACVCLFGIGCFSEERFGEAIGFPDSPLFGLMAIIIYGIAGNICYTFGWIVELFVKGVWKERSKGFGEISFVLGILFSVILTFAPVVLCAVVVIVKLLQAH
jgi:hypothetical protein